MATVNSRFLAIAAKQPSLNSGFQVRVLDYKDMTTLVAIMPEFTAFSFTQQLCDPGTGSVTLDTDSPWWEGELMNGLSNFAIRDREYVFEVWENGLRKFAFLGQTVEQAIIGDDEGHTTTISGPGIAQVLTWACIQRPGWPAKPPILKYQTIDTSTDGKTIVKKKIPIYRDVSSNDSLPAFLWRFPMKWTTMHMWYATLKAAQRRGVIKFVNPMFTALQDSNDQDWLYVRTLQTITDDHGYQPETPEENLLDWLNECTGQDYTKWFGQRLEWMMYPGFRLDVRRKIGVDRSKTVRFFTGQVMSVSRTRDRENIFNRITAVDVEGTESIATSKSSVTIWNLREQRNVTNKNVTDTALRAELASRYLEQSRNEKSEWSIQIPYDDPGRIPMRSFHVGDYISVTDTNNPLLTRTQKFRVMAITVTMGTDSSVPECEMTLQSIIESKLQELEKKVTQLINEPRNVDIESLSNVSIGDVPADTSNLVYNPETGKWEAKPVATAVAQGGYVDISVYIQATDPAGVTGNTVKTGDFWYQTVS